MSPIKVWSVDRDNVTKDAVTATTQHGCGGSKHIYAGRKRTSGIDYDYLTYIRFALDWSGVGKIVSATMVLYTDDQNGDFPPPDETTGTPKITVRRLTDSFSEGSNPDGTWDGGDWTVAAGSTDGQSVKAMSKAVDGLTRVSITPIVEAWAPATVRRRDGTAGGKKANHGLRIGSTSTDIDYRWSGWSNHATDSLLRPTIELVYEYGATTPNTPSGLSPVGSTGTFSGFSADFSDARPADTVAWSEVQVYTSAVTNTGQTINLNGGSLVGSERAACSNAEAIAYRSTLVPTTFELKTGTAYKWRVRHTDQEGQTSLWTGLQSLTITNTAPNPPTLSDVTLSDLHGFSFSGGAFSDPDGDTLLAYQLQVSQYPSGDTHWLDADFILWDSGRVIVSGDATSWSTQYGGPGLAAGSYHYRARQWDSRESVSAWSYGALTLLDDFDPDPGQQSNVQFAHKVPWRILIKGMGGNRGPGSVVAVIENAKSVGATKMYNSPGELHFTLTVDHPQISVIEPRQTHYALEVYSGDGWREVFAGLIVDYDATETGVIFYGVDYLGLFQFIYDERYDPANPEKSYADGGSKYVGKTISFIVQNQIQRAIDLTDSPVGFLTVGSVATMSNKVTTYSTMQSVLPFVTGLIDSHRQGTGARTRVEVVKSGSSYVIRVVDNPERTRNQLRLKYGELVQGYRVIPFGPSWASLQHGIGRTRDGVKVMYKSAAAPGIDTAVWGRFARVSVYEGVSDENDLIRRVKQDAIKAGKLGKQIGLGIRSGVLNPLDGYDITDTIPVEIVHGAVDTTNFGSGYWVIWGVAWETSDSGETSTVLTILPREDTSSPDPDLINENPISTTPEWQIGYTAPSTDVHGSWYMDQVTGQVYRWGVDPNTGLEGWVLYTTNPVPSFTTFGEDPMQVVKIVNGQILYSSDGGVTFSQLASGDGGDASGITQGNLPGGSNLIPDGSFEMAAFATMTSVTVDTATELATDVLYTGTAVSGTGSAAVIQLTPAP